MRRVDGLLTWNMGCGPKVDAPKSARQRRLRLLKQLLKEHDPSLIALQEAPSEAELRGTLGAGFDLVRSAGGVVAAHRSDRWSCDYNDVANGRVVVTGLVAVGAATSLWLFSIHGPALFKSAQRKGEFIRTQVAPLLRERRAADDSRSNVVAGDMNLPPFDDAITSEEGLRANRSWAWVARNSSGTNRALFNSTWILLGRHHLPGTLYRSSVDLDGPWFGCDQVMVSAGLSEHGGFAVDVVDVVGGKSLRKAGSIGMPDSDIGSDHLPIVSKLGVD